MTMDTSAIRRLYRRRARRYDGALRLLRAAGVRDASYRSRAVEHLGLRPGDTAIDLGCGTGLNFSHLLARVGSEGRVIGVDLTDAMLAQAAARVDQAGWKNVTLVESDVADVELPAGAGGIISTFALTLSPAFDDVIRRSAAALREGGRLAVVDLKEPERWPRWLVRFAAWTQKPFGVTLELAGRHPWESIRRHLHEVCYVEFYGGAIYLSVGERVG